MTNTMNLSQRTRELMPGFIVSAVVAAAACVIHQLKCLCDKPFKMSCF